MLKQVIRSNNNWLWGASNFSNIDLFEGISNKTREKVYNAAVAVKNTLFETDFQEAPLSLSVVNPIMYRIYESVRGYANRYNSLDHAIMPSTKEAMFIVTKILCRTQYLKVA